MAELVLELEPDSELESDPELELDSELELALLLVELSSSEAVLQENNSKAIIVRKGIIFFVIVNLRVKQFRLIKIKFTFELSLILKIRFFKKKIKNKKGLKSVWGFSLKEGRAGSKSADLEYPPEDDSDY